jgi:hypothetical protein
LNLALLLDLAVLAGGFAGGCGNSTSALSKDEVLALHTGHPMYERP